MSGEQTYVDDFFKGMEIPPEVEGLQGDTLGHIEDDVLTETGTLAEKQAEQAFIKEDPSITAKKVKGALQSAFPDLPKKHFSVQVNRLGDIDVKWVDYPAKKTVEEITKGYQSATYDKELETDIVHGYEENGQRIQGAGYITLSGTLSDLTKERMLQFADRIGLDTSNRQLAKAAIEKVAEGYYLLSHNEATAGLDAKEVLPVIEIPPTQQEVEAMKHEMVGQAKEQEKTREAFDPLKEITIEDTQTSAKQEAGEGEKVSYVIEVEDKPIDFTDTQADLANLKNGYTVKFSNG
ncbi:LPD29 domain-containing protein, partial [Listeria seeligeri]